MRGTIVLLGDLGKADTHEVECCRNRLQAAGWSIQVQAPVPRDQLAGVLRRASGLLLVTVAQSTIPLKLFDYLPAKRPILAVIEAKALWPDWVPHCLRFFCLTRNLPAMRSRSSEDSLLLVRKLNPCTRFLRSSPRNIDLRSFSLRLEFSEC